MRVLQVAVICSGIVLLGWWGSSQAIEHEGGARESLQLDTVQPLLPQSQLEVRSLRPEVEEPLQSAQFLDEKLGYGYSQHALWRTTDGGERWALVRRAPKSELLQNYRPRRRMERIQFLDPYRGWLLEGESLLYTTDGGASWRERNGAGLVLRSFHFWNESLGWIVGERLSRHPGESGQEWRGVILTSSDGGNTWREVPVSETSHEDQVYLDVFATSEQEVWVVGTRILRSVDKGATWSEVQISENIAGIPARIRFVNSQVGWIVMNQGAAYLLTQDAGRTWQIRAGPQEARGFTDVLYINADEAWVTAGPVYRSIDSGFTWEEVVDTGEHTITVLFAGADGVIVVGDRITKIRCRKST